MVQSRYENPIPARASRDNIWALAEDIARKLGFKRGDPIEPLVTELGGKISFNNPAGEEVQESIRVEPQGGFTIFLPAVTSARRDKFTIAHELGHLFLHFPFVQRQHPGQGMRATRWVDESNSDLQRCEWEANWFAASFVMPKADFIAAYEKIKDVEQLADRFGVSQKAAEVRIKSLGLKEHA